MKTTSPRPVCALAKTGVSRRQAGTNWPTGSLLPACRTATVRFWPNPAIQSSLAGCQAENPAMVATGRYRPEADTHDSKLTYRRRRRSRFPGTPKYLSADRRPEAFSTVTKKCRPYAASVPNRTWRIWMSPSSTPCFAQNFERTSL